MIAEMAGYAFGSNPTYGLIKLASTRRN